MTCTSRIGKRYMLGLLFELQKAMGFIYLFLVNRLQVMEGLVGRLQDFEDEVRVAAIEGITAAAKHSLALLDGGLAPLTQARDSAVMQHQCTRVCCGTPTAVALVQATADFMGKDSSVVQKQVAELRYDIAAHLPALEILQHQ